MRIGPPQRGHGSRKFKRDDLGALRVALARSPRMAVFHRRARFGHPGGIVLGEYTDPLKDTPGFDPGKPRTWAGRQGRGHLIAMNPADGNGHVLVLAASAGYKTSGIVIPNILHYEGPIVVFDPKGDLYARTRKARRDMGYNAVVIDADSGFDPFRMLAPLAGQAPSVYHTMAKTLMPLAGRASDISEYFHEMSVSLFAALTAHFVQENSDNIARDISIFINRDRETVINEAAMIAQEYNMPFITDEMAGLASLDARTFPGVVKGISNKLAFVRYPDIASYGQSGKSPQEHLRALNPLTDIYINIPGLAARDFASFPRLLIGGMLVVSELMEQPDRPRARRLFLIDEARVLGGMDVLVNVRDAGRSIGMHLMLIYQNLGQVVEAWGGQSGADAWLDSCEARVVSAVGSSRTAADISAMLGKRTIRVVTEGSSSNSPVMTPMGGSVGTTELEQLRDIPLLTQAALGQLPGHGSVIFTRRSKPILATKAIWFTRADMKDRVRRAEDIEDELTVTRRRQAVMDNIAGPQAQPDTGVAAGADHRPDMTDARNDTAPRAAPAPAQDRRPPAAGVEDIRTRRDRVSEPAAAPAAAPPSDPAPGAEAEPPVNGGNGASGAARDDATAPMTEISDEDIPAEWLEDFPEPPQAAAVGDLFDRSGTRSRKAKVVRWSVHRFLTRLARRRCRRRGKCPVRARRTPQ